MHAGDQETFGLSVLEAMACGTPAVVAGAGALPELVDASTGAVAAASSGAAFAEAIASLFERDRTGLARAARGRGLAGDWGRVLPGLLEHYRRLLGLRSPTPAQASGGQDMATPTAPAHEAAP